VVVSPRNLKQNIVELSSRDKSLKTSFSVETAADEIAELVFNALRAIK
jgi:hypothetical protein